MNEANDLHLKTRPYWLDGIAPMPPLADALPAHPVDVLIVGAGYTGLSAAVETARAGRSTLVIDARTPGFGCSCRNGGQVSPSLRVSFAKLAARFGPEKARDIRAEGHAALQWIVDFIDREKLDCDFKRTGRFQAAHTPGNYERLARESEDMKKREGVESFAVPRAEQRSELGSDLYFGGVVFPDHHAVQPARYHRELLRLALDAGAQIVADAPALNIESAAQSAAQGAVKRRRVETPKGSIRARDVIIAANGYRDDLVPWLKRRVIPLNSYVIATEELPENVVDEAYPTDRTVTDTCRAIYYHRASPDRRRIVFGARVTSRDVSPAVAAPLLHRKMSVVFPQLRDRRPSHAWRGSVAYNFDRLPHIGVHDGIRYAMGYGGSGVSMSGYLGMRAAQQTLGRSEGRTAFDDLPHRTSPFYRGDPWFVPAIVACYRFTDWLQCRMAGSPR